MAERARLLTENEMVTVYPSLLEECFGVRGTAEGVSRVGVIEDENGEIKSFMAGYFHNDHEFYIKLAGVMPCARSVKGKPAQRYLNAGMKFFGARFYTTRHLFGDTASQRVLADTKFLVHGTQTDTGGNVWIQWIKDMGARDE